MIGLDVFEGATSLLATGAWPETLSGIIRLTDLLPPLAHGWLAPPANQSSFPQVSDASAGPGLRAPGPGRNGE